MINRHIKILEVLSRQQRVEVTTLSDLLGVSQVTIRKDLDQLEEKGLILRQHGYACLDVLDDVGKRMVQNYGIKKRIAVAAAETIRDGEIIMIESGSCCTFLAEELALTKKDITLITNSVFIANYIRHMTTIKIILLGGYYQPEAQVVVGPMTKRCGEIFFTNKFFIGVDGFSPKTGFTGKDHMRIQTIQDLAEFSQRIIVLTESEKFRQQGVLNIMKTEKVSEVFTDEDVPVGAETLLRTHNVTINKVPLSE